MRSPREEIEDARRDLCCRDHCVFSAIARLREFLQSHSLKMSRLRLLVFGLRSEVNRMNAESIIMLLISAGLMVYLLYALLRPENF